mgnify:CR=1 FL=1
MADSVLPAYVDTRKVFLQQTQIKGIVALERLSRFKESLASDVGKIWVSLNFSINESGQKLIRGKLSADIEVFCQRCLEPLTINLVDEIKLILLSDENEINRLAANLDPWVCSNYRLYLARMIEEQLILCMPLITYHPDRVCLDKLKYKGRALAQEVDSAQENKTMDDPKNPFHILKTLKE